jgi:rhomboid protease GluP
MFKAFKQHKITYSIILLNVLMYFVCAVGSQSIIDIKIDTLVHMGALFGPYTVQKGEWLRLFTAMFLHGGMTHLLMNMFSLYIIGRGVERYFDTRSYLGIYLFSGLLGGLASLYMHPQSVGVGASGAIFGVFGALAGFFLAHRGRIEAQFKVFMKELTIIIVINMVLGFSIPSVDVSAHVAGLVVGIVGGYVISKSPSNIWVFSLVMLLLMGAIMSYLPTQYAYAQF